MGSKVEDFNYIFQHNENINFCYDTGHNLICKSNYNLLKDKIKIIHISDNNTKEDEHLGLMKGKLDHNELKYILSINPEFLVLEMNFDDIEESLHILKKSYLR